MLDLPGALAAYEEAVAHDFDEEGLREAAEVGLQRSRSSTTPTHTQLPAA